MLTVTFGTDASIDVCKGRINEFVGVNFLTALK